MNSFPYKTFYQINKDINECDITENEDSCGELGICRNFPGGWECGCEDGFEFDQLDQNCIGKLKFILSIIVFIYFIYYCVPKISMNALFGVQATVGKLKLA